MRPPSFIRTVTAGAGFTPVLRCNALVGFPNFGITTDRELDPAGSAPCPEGYWIVRIKVYQQWRGLSNEKGSKAIPSLHFGDFVALLLEGERKQLIPLLRYREALH